MDETFSRERLLFGDAAMQRLWHAHVAVFGVGGVGGATSTARSSRCTRPSGRKKPA